MHIFSAGSYLASCRSVVLCIVSNASLAQVYDTASHESAGTVQLCMYAQVIVTNTVPVPPERSFPELTVLSVANLLGETIWRVFNSSSVTTMF